MVSSRVKRLRDEVMQEASRKKELWPKKNVNLLDDNPGLLKESVIVRKALAFSKFLGEMPIKISEGELIVGKIAYGSLGMGAQFIDYTTKEEKRKAAKIGLGIASVFGHSCPDYHRVLRDGLSGLKKYIEEEAKKLGNGEAVKK